MTLDATQTVREIVRNNPAAVGVFETAGIDYCCGGGRSLGEACEKANLPLDQFLAKLSESLRVPPIKEDCHWLTCPLSELADHIVEVHHAYVRRELPVLAALAEKVNLRHGHKYPKLGQLRDLVESLQQELFAHLTKEERVLFPALKSMEEQASQGMSFIPAFFGDLINPIRHMMEEHDDAGELLKGIRAATNNYQAPEDACFSFQTLYNGLKAFEQDLHRHIHLENNILFPRSLEFEKGRSGKAA
jgi:regulator of cell morphogenesis and NO signaling